MQDESDFMKRTQDANELYLKVLNIQKDHI